jgi:hypothetical protein
LSSVRIDLIEVTASLGMDGVFTAMGLPAPDRRVDVKRVNLQAAAHSPDALGGDKGCPAPQKAIEDNLAAGGAVQQRIGDKLHRLCRRVQGKAVPFFSNERWRVG